MTESWTERVPNKLKWGFCRPSQLICCLELHLYFFTLCFMTLKEMLNGKIMDALIKVKGNIDALICLTN